MNQEKIGKFIKELREKNNMTQDELASKLFVDRTLISKWEKGSTLLTSEHLKSLSTIFNISADELLSGEFITNKNKDKISNIKYDIYDNIIINKKRLKILFRLIIIIILLFLLYFFFTFYNSVSIYYVNTEPDKIKLNEGMLIKTKDYLIFKLDLPNNANIKGVNLYYNINNNPKTIIKSNDTSIYIVDYIDNQEYFEFSKLDDILNNTYLKIEYENGKTINTKIAYTKFYSNKNIFFTGKNQNIIDADRNGDEPSIISDKFKTAYGKYSEFTTSVQLENIKYNVDIFEDTLRIEYIYNKSKYVMDYTKLDYEYLSKSKNGVEIYSSALEKNQCQNNDLEECNNDLEIINKILDYLIKNKK